MRPFDSGFRFYCPLLTCSDRLLWWTIFTACLKVPLLCFIPLGILKLKYSWKRLTKRKKTRRDTQIRPNGQWGHQTLFALRWSNSHAKTPRWLRWFSMPMKHHNNEFSSVPAFRQWQIFPKKNPKIIESICFNKCAVISRVFQEIRTATSYKHKFVMKRQHAWIYIFYNNFP